MGDSRHELGSAGERRAALAGAELALALVGILFAFASVAIAAGLLMIGTAGRRRLRAVS